MAEHGDNYIRQVDPDGKEIGVLGVDCGHHCGAITVGHAGGLIRHCNCNECHNGALRSKREVVMDISKDAQDTIVERVDKYMVSLSSKHKPTLVIRVTEDQERRIRQLTPAQLRNFRTVMGG